MRPLLLLAAAAVFSATPAFSATGNINASGSKTYSCSVNDANIALSETASDTLSGSGTTAIVQNASTTWTLEHTGTTAPNGASVTSTIEVSGQGGLDLSVNAGDSDSADLGGVKDTDLDIDISVTEDSGVLIAGDYEVTATLTCEAK